jgi:hypothetical protein
MWKDYDAFPLSRVDWEKIVAMLMNPAPLLERLEFQYSDSPRVVLTLPHDLFSGDAPRLRELELGGCSVPWGSPVLRTLTSLKVSYTDDLRGDAMERIGHVMSALRSMPCLEVLDLQGVLPSIPVEGMSNSSEPTILLPHLKDIHLKCDLRSCTYLLNELVYPATTSVTLDCTIQLVYFEISSKYLPSMHFLGTIFNKAHPIQRLTTSCSVRLIRLSTLDIVSAQGQSSAPQINVRLDMEGVTTYRKAAIENLLPPFWASMQCLESLQVIHGYNSVDAWQHGLTGSQLKYLEVVVNGSGIASLHAFSTCLLPQAGTSEGQSRVPLPSLRELAIKRWDIRERVNHESCFECLKTCLEDRKKHHAAIHKLSLVECRHVTVDHVAKLQEVVSHVTWDRPLTSDNIDRKISTGFISDDDDDDDDDSEDGWYEGWQSDGNYNWSDDGDHDSNYSY